MFPVKNCFPLHFPLIIRFILFDNEKKKYMIKKLSENKIKTLLMIHVSYLQATWLFLSKLSRTEKLTETNIK